MYNFSNKYPISYIKYLDYIYNSDAIYFDNFGLPLVDYNIIYSKITLLKPNYELIYTPVTIFQFGLGHYEIFKENGSEYSLDMFFSAAKWAISNLKIYHHNFGVWLHNWDEPQYLLKPPWVSSMAQGLGLSLLLRAHHLTNDPIYIEYANFVINSFSSTIKEFNFLYLENAGAEINQYWLEEYPSDNPPHVLNGNLFAIIGLIDYNSFNKNHEINNLIKGSILAIENNLHLYENIYYSRYSLSTFYNTTPTYHKIHIDQLKFLGNYLSSSKMIFVANYWQKYLSKKYLYILFSLRAILFVSRIIKFDRYMLRMLEIFSNIRRLKLKKKIDLL